MKTVSLIFVLMMLLPEMASAKSCAAMNQELTGLRKDYHEYVTAPATGGPAITFDGLVEILDKIVDLKNEMRKSCPNVKIPPRGKFPADKR